MNNHDLSCIKLFDIAMDNYAKRNLKDDKVEVQYITTKDNFFSIAID